MPSLYDAYWRHTDFYLIETERADQLFSNESTQGKGISIFDQNKEQIEIALEWITHQDPTIQTDILLARFVDALSAIGMVRYSVREKLIPLNERKIAAAQRLEWKDLEADSFDGQGILYAFLGYLPQAVQYFEKAYDIAQKIGDKELKRDIQIHIKLAKKQLKKNDLLPSAKFISLLRLILLGLRFIFTNLNKNPFTQIGTINSIATIYLDLEKWDLAIQFYQRAHSMSQKQSYLFGELEASLGLLQAEMSKSEVGGETVYTSIPVNLASDFEWSTDLSVFEILLETAPAIKNVEALASHLAKKNDPRVNEIYERLDQIMLRTNEIVSVVREGSVQRHEVLLDGLRGIKDNLTSIMKLFSGD